MGGAFLLLFNQSDDVQVDALRVVLDDGGSEARRWRTMPLGTFGEGENSYVAIGLCCAAVASKRMKPMGRAIRFRSMRDITRAFNGGIVIAAPKWKQMRSGMRKAFPMAWKRKEGIELS